MFHYSAPKASALVFSHDIQPEKHYIITVMVVKALVSEEFIPESHLVCREAIQKACHFTGVSVDCDHKAVRRDPCLCYNIICINDFLRREDFRLYLCGPLVFFRPYISEFKIIFYLLIHHIAY